MKRLKRILCLVLALAVVMSGFAAFAESRRINPRHIRKPLDRKTPNTVMLYDFTNSDIGASPVGFGSSADVTTAQYDVGNGYLKNCLVATDRTHDSSYTGPNTSAPLAATEGITSVEMRYKYLPVEPSSFASVIFAFDKGGKRVARFTIASANGASLFCDRNSLEASRIYHDTWYTLKVVFDFDENAMDAYLTNEATGVTKGVSNVAWYTDGEYDSLDTFVIQGMAYGGTWVIDYIRQEKNVEKTDLGDTIEKGRPQINIPSPVSHGIKNRTNITLDGKYKYTSAAPVVTENGNVKITAKNLSRILGLTYGKKDGLYTISSADKVLEFTPGSASAKADGRNITLSEVPQEADGQLMVPIEDVAGIFGIGYSFDEASDTVVLTTGEEAKADE